MLAYFERYPFEIVDTNLCYVAYESITLSYILFMFIEIKIFILILVCCLQRSLQAYAINK